EVSVIESTARIGGHQSNRAEAATADCQGNDDDGLEPYLQQKIKKVLVIDALSEHLFRNLRIELSHSGSQDSADAVRAIKARRKTRVHLVRPRNLFGINVCDRESFDRPAVIQHVDRAPVRKSRHHKASHCRKGLLIIKRRSQL